MLIDERRGRRIALLRGLPVVGTGAILTEAKRAGLIEDEVTRVVNEIRNLLSNGVPPEHILVLHATWDGANRVLDRLRNELGRNVVADPHETARRDCLRVCSLGAATGLESPVVFMLGINELFEAARA